MSGIPFAGLSPASAYVLQGQAIQEPPLAILADKIDPNTGELRSIVRGHTIADGMVIHAARVQRGTGAAVLETGNRLRTLKNVDEKSALTVESLWREALAPARDAGVVELVRVKSAVDAGDGTQVNAVIEYRDLLNPNRAGRELQRLAFSP